MKIKKHLNFSSLREGLSDAFHKVIDWRQGKKVRVSLHDALMSGFACMHFQDPLLLQFQQRMQDDHVAGERYYGEDIQKAINAPCMIQLQTGEMLIRFLEETKPGIYQLTCTNPKTTIKPKRQKDVNILSAAPILWIRRKSIKVKT